MSPRRYYVRVWDAGTAEVRWEQGVSAAVLARTVDEAERRIRAMQAMRSLEDHILYVVVASEGATR